MSDVMKPPSYVHDRLVYEGGAEAVLHMLIDRFGVCSESKLFVLYSPWDRLVHGSTDLSIVTALPTWINQLLRRWSRSSQRILRFFGDYRNLIVMYPLLCWLLRRKIRKQSSDRLVISSFAAVKNVVPVSGWERETVLYLHSPMQYIWENVDEYLHKLSGITLRIFKRLIGPWRRRDQRDRTYGIVYTNSYYTASCAKQYYRLESKVWYPHVDPAFLHSSVVVQPKDYFVYVGRLVRFIREVDRIIELCSTLQLPLLVLGSGPDEQYLQSIAGSTVVFVGQVHDPREKVRIIAQSRGLINLAKESCGISTMEALSLGVPVFGFGAGGTRELVLMQEEYRIDEVVDDELPPLVNENGVLVYQKTLTSLQKALLLFAKQSFDRATIQHSFRAYYKKHQIGLFAV